MKRAASLSKIETGLIEFLNTPASELCNATAAGDLEQVRALVQAGTDPNVGDYDRRTALHLAASEGLLEVATYLIDEAGADPSPTDRFGVRKHRSPRPQCRRARS